jgi:hypothetical protein
MSVSLILQYYDKDLKNKSVPKNNSRIEGWLPCVGYAALLQGWLCVGVLFD